MWYKDSANRCTFLPRLDGHFLRYLLHHQVPFGITWLNIGTEQGGIERIGLGINRYRTMNDIRMRTKRTSGVSRSGECEHIPLEHVLE